MVIPTHARQTGITVRHMCVSISVLVASFGVPIAFSCQASALLPVSDVPIVGQPVADTANTVTGDVVEPVVATVAEALPEPVGQVVQAPVAAVTEATAPIIGPSSHDNIPHQIVSRILPQASIALATPAADPTPGIVTDAVATKTPTITLASRQSQSTDASSDKKQMPIMGGFVSSLLGNYIPAAISTAKNFVAASKDASVFIAAMSILLIMALLLARFISMITTVNSRPTTTNELVLMRHDLTQTSVLMLTLVVFGAVSIFVLLFGSML